MPAIGGIITTDGLFTVHTFSSPGSFSFILPGNIVADILVVGANGGGGGGRNGQWYWAEGGGGAVNKWTNQSLLPGTIPVVVGARGIGRENTDSQGDTGGTSSFNTTYTAVGGQGGRQGSNNSIGGTSGNGHAGSQSNDPGGGGGGQSENGGTDGTGAGGDGVVDSISGVSDYYGGGQAGGGSSNNGLGFRDNGIVIVRYLTSLLQSGSALMMGMM